MATYQINGADPQTSLGTITYFRYDGRTNLPMASYPQIQEVHAVSPTNPSRIDIYNPKRGALNTLRFFQPSQSYIVYSKKFSSNFTITDGVNEVQVFPPQALYSHNVQGNGIGWPNIVVWRGLPTPSVCYGNFIKVLFYPNPSRTMLRAWIPGTSPDSMAPTFEFGKGYTIYAKSNFTIGCQVPPPPPPPSPTQEIQPPGPTPTWHICPPVTPLPGNPNRLLAFNNDDIHSFIDDKVEAFAQPTTEGTFIGGGVQPCRSFCNPDIVTITGLSTGVCYGGVNGIYTEDSALGVVAVHAGFLQPGQIGRFRLIPRGWVPNYAAVTANGITTLAWNTGWCGFQLQLIETVVVPTNPVTFPDGNTMTLYTNGGQPSCTANSSRPDPVVVRLTGVASGNVWGGANGVYTDDSNWGRAAVHAGLLAVGESGVFQVIRTGWVGSYAANFANGVQTSAWTTGWCGVRITRIVPQNPPLICTLPSENQPICVLPQPAAIDGNKLRMYTGGSTPNCAPNNDYTSPQLVRLTGNTSGTVWGGQGVGSNRIYTDDSDFGAAAVHAGLLQNGQTGIFQLVRVGWVNAYQASSQNGVTTRPYSGWCGVSINRVGTTVIPVPVNPNTGNVQVITSALCHGDVISFMDIVDNPVVVMNQNYVVGINPTSIILPGLTPISQLPFKRTDGCPKENVPPKPGLAPAPGAPPPLPDQCGGNPWRAKPAFPAPYNNRIRWNQCRATLPARMNQYNAAMAAFNAKKAQYDASVAAVNNWTNTYTKSPWIDRCWLQAEDCQYSLLPNEILVTGHTQGSVWGGDGVYTADSTIATAAIHAGLINPGETAIIRVINAGYRTGFSGGSTQYNVTSNNWNHRYCAIQLQLVQKLTQVVNANQFVILYNNLTVSTWGNWIVRPNISRVRRISDGSIFYITGTGTFATVPSFIYRVGE